MRINVISAQGSPNDPKTWSGTAKNITVALKKRNCLEDSFEAGAENIGYKFIKLLLKKAYRLFSKKANLAELSWYLVRRLNSESAKRLTSTSKSNHTLHFGTLCLPFGKKPENQFHYLFTDGTWNLWSKFATDISAIGSEKLKYIDYLEKKAYEQVDHIFSISEYVKDNLIGYYQINSQKITVVGTGTGIIEPFYGEKNYSNGKILFAAKGRFDDKGGNLVLKAFELAVKANPKLHLSIVGQNEYTDRNVHPNITTYGFVSIEELQSLFDTHSLFLMPALNEPWGLVYIEAMLCKMPIVGLNRNSFPELVADGKHGVAINEPDETKLANIIINLFSEPRKMQEMGLNAQKYALRKFTWDNTVNSIIETINGKQTNV